MAAALPSHRASRRAGEGSATWEALTNSHTPTPAASSEIAADAKVLMDWAFIQGLSVRSFFNGAGNA